MMRMVAIGMAFHGIDLLTGIIVAIKNHNINSSKLRDGVFKKVGFMICYAIAYLVDSQGEHIGFVLPCQVLPVMISYGVLTELVSVIENVHRLNPDILPEKLRALFQLDQ